VVAKKTPRGPPASSGRRNFSEFIVTRVFWGRRRGCFFLPGDGKVVKAWWL